MVTSHGSALTTEVWCTYVRLRKHREAMARSISAAARSCPRCCSICPAHRNVASGLTIPWKAMSGADPCTGSNIEGKRRVGSRLALGASPMLPIIMAEMSLRMSPNRLEATTTSKLSGLRE